MYDPSEYCHSLPTDKERTAFIADLIRTGKIKNAPAACRLCALELVGRDIVSRDGFVLVSFDKNDEPVRGKG